jgi:hypothetical protein
VAVLRVGAEVVVTGAHRLSMRCGMEYVTLVCGSTSSELQEVPCSVYSANLKLASHYLHEVAFSESWHSLGPTPRMKLAST